MIIGVGGGRFVRGVLEVREESILRVRVRLVMLDVGGC